MHKSYHTVNDRNSSLFCVEKKPQLYLELYTLSISHETKFPVHQGTNFQQCMLTEGSNS